LKAFQRLKGNNKKNKENKMKEFLIGMVALVLMVGSATLLMSADFDAARGGTVFTTQVNLGEASTPAAIADSGHIYTKTDNELYFQDGAGTEHTVGFSDGDTVSGAVIFSSTVAATLNDITVGSGTGLTVVDTGTMRSQVYVVTVDYTGLSAAAGTAKHTIATLPAGMKLVSLIADTTIKYIGGAVSAATIIVGIDSGDTNAFLVSHDVFAAAVVQGDATAEPGVELIAATATQGGYIDWSGTTVISTLIATTSADTDALTQGSTTYYLETVQVK
jgi:hypothetical protein